MISSSELLSGARPRLLVLAVLGFLMAGCGSEPRDDVWVIGLDGADWDLLDPMIERGELPNLAALRDGGASGVLLSDQPMLSPILWNSIATGKTADLHGVTWFMTDAPDGTKMPVSSHERKVRAFWDIASEAGLRVGIVGWWATWPADPINGFMVTDYVGWHSFGVTGRGQTDLGKAYPPEILDRVKAAIPSPDAVDTRLVSSMVNLPADRLSGGSGEGSYDDPVSHLRQSIATSLGFTDFVIAELERGRPDLMSVYYEGTDAVLHLFGDYAPPRLPWVEAADYDAFAGTVAAYWRWQDSLLGELLEHRTERTTVFVVSDHGFRTGDERRKEDHFDIETADADHMPDGLVILNGPGIRAGTRIRGADIYDVAPSVLYALDLPVGADMKGRVLTDAFTEDHLAVHPVASVPTYETGPRQRADAVARDRAAGEELEKMLRSLGYISGTSSGEDGDASLHTVEQTVNLATIYMRQGRADEAVTLLTEADREHPGYFEIRLNLAQALSRSGRRDQGEAVYRELLAENPDRLEVYEDLAVCLIQGGKTSEALEVYDAGLDRDPVWVPGLVGRGRVLTGEGRLEDAKRALDRAMNEDPRDPDLHFYLGVLRAAQKDDAGAVRSYRRALELEPGHSAAAVQLSRTLAEMGQVQQAAGVLDRAVEILPDDPAIRKELGALYLQNGQAALAVPQLKKARELEPENVNLIGDLGIALAMTGKMPAAVAAFEDIVKLEPGMADAYTQLGSLYLQVQDPVKAKAAFEEAIRLDPTQAMAYFQLGRIVGRQGNVDEARRLNAKARKLDPSLPEN